MTTFMVMTSAVYVAALFSIYMVVKAVYVAALFSIYMVVKTLNGMRG